MYIIGLICTILDYMEVRMFAPSEKQFWKYILPSMLTMFLGGFYAIVDGFFVGQAVGDLGLAAINLAWPIASFLLAAGTGIGVGGSVIMSTRLGEDVYKRQTSPISAA